tara:strand:- start:991 stop:2016 length:1026 start_codon:yes stop_codon:yes gene_type:complete
MKQKQAKIVITTGDEAGVGPEIILKGLQSEQLPKNIDILIVGSKKILNSTYNSLKNLGIKNMIDPSSLDICDMEIPKINKFSHKANTGNASFFYLKHAIEIVKSIPNAALVTSPICKESWALSGHKYSGQTELLAESCAVSNVGMLFTAKSPHSNWRFNTLLATTHIPINQISSKINAKLITNKLDLLYKFCTLFTDSPNIKVAGLNPHAGEEGILGLEEKTILNKTLQKWGEDNKLANIQGPVSPDSCWISSAKSWFKKQEKEHDGILAMYHDQGLIPMKIIAANYSVNTTLGLPIIRTSPDHGTGFDIAGKGIAQSQSIVEAIKTANDLIIKSNLLNSH